MKILVITRHTPFPWDDGAGAYLSDVLTYLKKNEHTISVLWLKPHDSLLEKGIWAAPPSLNNTYKLILPDSWKIGSWYIFPNQYWLPIKARSLNIIKKSLNAFGIRVGEKSKKIQSPGSAQEEANWMAEISDQELRIVAEYTIRKKWDVVIANYAWITPVFDLFPRAKKICLQSDVGWRRSEILSSTGIGWFTRNDETRLLKKADVVVAISDADKREFQEMKLDNELITCPKSAENKGISISKGTQLLFVGSGNQLNTEGLDWFLTHCWEKVRKKIPNVSLTICGSVDQTIKVRPERVEFAGKVDSLAEYYRKADVVIIPLLRATGLNIKLIEAASFGKPIVASSIVLQGGHWFCGSILTFNSVDECVKQITDLLSDEKKREDYSKRGQEVVEKQFSPDACYGGLNQKILSK